MGRLVNLGNALLLLVAWLHLLAGLRFGLMTDLAPLLAALGLLLETLLLLVIFRASLRGAAPWRKLLPAVVAALCIGGSYLAAERRAEAYIRQHGFPRRYYAPAD